MRFGRRVRRTRRGDFEIRLPDVERELLHRVALDLRALLEDDPDRQPTLRRLFPTAYPDDEEAAGDFRRYTEATLRDGKAASAATVIDSLEEAGLPDEPEDGVFIDVELDPATAMTWMRSFTDMRLAIATRLGVEEGDEDYWAELPEDDPRAQVHDIYEWLGFLQETLVRSAA
jgi:hypothetical protein